MILTIKGADFSGSGLGTNTSVSISYNGNVSGTPGFIEKNTALTSKITIKTGYTYNSISSVTVGGSAITGYTSTDNGDGTVKLTIPANLITGKIVVNVSTTAVSGGEVVDPEQPGTGGDSGETPSVPTGNLITLGTKQTNKKLGSGSSTPTSGDGYDVYEDIPVSAANVYKFTDVYRSWWKTAEKTDIVSFNPGNKADVSPKNASYLSITTTSNGNPSVELIYDGSSNTRPSGENIITNGTFNDNKALSSSSYELTAKDGYYVYDKIPVTTGKIYKISGALRIWWLDSSQNGLKTENLNSVGGLCVAPTNAAYISVTIASEQVPQSDAYMICLQ